MQSEGRPAEAFGPGDVVWIPPILRHRHGAAAAGPMVDFALAEALDGATVTWMESVGDDQYAAAGRRAGP